MRKKEKIILNKLVLGITCLLLTFGNLFAQNQITRLAADYTVTGKINAEVNSWIYLIHGDRFKKGNVIDSSKIINGEFTFSGSIIKMEPILIGMHSHDSKGKQLPSFQFQGPFFLSPGHLQVRGSFDWRHPMYAYGNQAQDHYNIFKDSITPLNSQMNQIVGEKSSIKKNETKKLEALNKRYSIVSIKTEEAIKNHILKFPNSFISAYLGQSLLVNADPDTVRAIYDKLTTDVKNSEYGQLFLKNIENMEPTSIGKISPSFRLSNPEGKTISLSDIKSNYILIDFWASWCSPCRREHPVLINAYNKYRSKGFEIVSISMDTDKAAWIKAIKEDGLTWTQVSDLKGSKSETGKKYAIKQIPMNFLVDKNYKIIARDLTGNELVEKLGSLL